MVGKLVYKCMCCEQELKVPYTPTEQEKLSIAINGLKNTIDKMIFPDPRFLENAPKHYCDGGINPDGSEYIKASMTVFVGIELGEKQISNAYISARGSRSVAIGGHNIGGVIMTGDSNISIR